MKTTGSTPTNSAATSIVPPTPIGAPTPTDAAERLAYVALALTPGLGGRGLATLLSRFGSATAIIEASRRRVRGSDPAEQRLISLLSGTSLRTAERYVAASASADVLLLTPADPDFPARLRSIPDPPPVLFLRGRMDCLDLPAVAIVGSRDHTEYGREVAHQLSVAAASAGICVVSGMARGLDAVAHEGALQAAGATIGVLGNGIGVIYPAANRELYRQVEERGLLLSEHPPGERPGHAGAFPRRNRLISGLADVLVVVEAAKGSGTMLTVAAALEQGREVMAVPGPVTSPTSAGTNQLLCDGADPLLHPDDLVGKFAATARTRPVGVGPVDPTPCNLSPTEARVFDALTVDPRHIDDLTLAVGLPVGEVLGVLCGLELAGLVEQMPGTRFRRVLRVW
jgi:DNA processing protein